MLGLCFLLLLLTTTASVIDIQCQDADDYYHLMYQICSGQVLCKEIYYLDVPLDNNTIIIEQDFHRFKYQLSLIHFYPTNGSSSSSHHLWDGQPLVELVYPPEWQPGITIIYNGSTTPCSETFNLASPNTTEELQYIYVSLALLQIYKQYVSNEHYCPDFNERPIFNPVTGKFICFCTNDKLCNSVASYRQFIFYIMLLILSTVLLYTFLTYVVSFLLLGRG